MYCAIIGDIIDSREIENREMLQEKYKAVFNQINHNFDNDIGAYFQIRDGDGFHGLLKNPKNLTEIIMRIRLAIIPTQIRIGIGFGTITTKIEKNNIPVIDGSAYNVARDGMDDISQYKNKYEKVYQTTILKYDPGIIIDKNCKRTCETYEKLINSVFCACSFIERNWDKIHAETILGKMENKTQRQIGQELGISQAAVQKRISSSNYYTYEYYIENLTAVISDLWEKVYG